MPCGPKPKTRKNSPSKPSVLPLAEALYATSDLTPVAQEEFQRLARVLDSRGTLERVDIAVLTECARIKALLDRAQADVDGPVGGLDADKVRIVTALNSHRLALLRALGLTLMPSRSVVKTVAKDDNQADPIAGKIKLHG